MKMPSFISKRKLSFIQKLRANLFAWLRFRTSILPWPNLCELVGFRFHDWLMSQPEIVAAIEWTFPDSGPLAYADWPAEKQSELEEAFWGVHNDGLADPPQNLYVLADDEKPKTKLSDHDAWELFRFTLGHCLALEFSNLTPWSLRDYDYQELIILLNGRWMFTRVEGGYDIANGYSQVVPPPPKMAYSFIREQNLLADTKIATIGNVTEWIRQNLNHHLGERSALVFEYNWQYRGYPPVSRMITRTPTTDPRPGYQDNCVLSRTAGCWGTTGFYICILRLMNIPVNLQLLYNIEQTVHAAPYFVSEGLWLSHGDDPYGGYAFATPPIPATEMLIDEAKFNLWFDDVLPIEERGLNIGRRMHELIPDYWPNYILRKYCEDMAAGNTDENSEVYQTLSRYGALDLATWETYKMQMTDKINAFGGCENIPYPNRNFDEYCD